MKVNEAIMDVEIAKAEFEKDIMMDLCLYL
jgi:hypothetical protein